MRGCADREHENQFGSVRGGKRGLTTSYLDEGPTWSPNGRVIMFFREDQRGKTRLYSVDLTGYNLREVVTPLDGSDPAWSPRLPM